MDCQSLKVRDFVALLRAARRADLVVWGGGELLKDYTNKLALWYWVLKMFLVSRVSKNLYGLYQGIGPTRSALSRRLIVFIVRRCKAFIARDHESSDKLVAWGVLQGTVLSSSDPAVVPTAGDLSRAARDRLELQFGITDDFLRRFICIAPRDWFHYSPGGLLPHRHKTALRRLLGKSGNGEPPARAQTYRKQLIELTDSIIEKHDVQVLLLPMHMTETDVELCSYIEANSDHGDMIRVLDQDSMSPLETRALVAMAEAMVGFRLHSTIVAISGGVPSINVYYVDKGRVFFDQIGQSRFALPIERVLEEGFVAEASALLDALLKDRESIKHDIERRVESLRKLVRSSFEAAFANEPGLLGSVDG
jgi:polysaccharide pyruvyl transferase WcaK-like protein